MHEEHLVCDPLYPKQTCDPDIQYEHIFCENALSMIVTNIQFNMTKV